MTEKAESACAREDALKHVRAHDLSLARLHDLARQEIFVQDHEHLPYHPPVLVKIDLLASISMHAQVQPCSHLVEVEN
jgi:hypothetical protein